ncbi:thymidine phosphorylase [Cupriavidus alkaliphilus]|uniref:Thymidine phosphorylase n=1 Tax=Cupriavidus alkaliphilus TaxID=942866 RepID=A0A7W4VED0_9BURK|nr:thymidine phosphorylase [Cupriavidus alkaliphilus]
MFRRDLTASRGGIVTAIDNRQVSRIAKLAGAPRRQVAGLALHGRVGDAVDAGAPLCTLHAQASGELDYAFGYAPAHAPFVIE